MGVGLVFLLGIANFALHRAAVESGHPLLGMIRESSRLFAPRVTYGVEFVLLVAALMLAHGGADGTDGFTGWVWIYAAYSAGNAMSTWAILTGRV